MHIILYKANNIINTSNIQMEMFGSSQTQADYEFSIVKLEKVSDSEFVLKIVYERKQQRNLIL